MSEMTSQERIDAAIALEPVDRVPIIPLVDFSAARSHGVDIASFQFDPDLSLSLIMQTFDEMGGWDAAASPNAPGTLGLYPMATLPVNLPGKQLPPDTIPQFDEREIMTVEDYDFVLEHGWGAFAMEAYPRLGFDISFEDLPAALQAGGARVLQDMQAWEDRDVMVFIGTVALPPFEALAMSRSIKEFMIDLYRRPEKVLAVIDCMYQETLDTSVDLHNLLAGALKMSPRVGFIGGARSTMLAPKLFDKFVWPYIKRLTLDWLDAGITPMFHFDSNWTPYLEHFLELPPRSTILELDSATDIFKAKEILKGHMCIMGDVPAPLLALGTVDEVKAYVKKLIDVVGEDNGFILSSGCSVPVDAKTENVQAMIEIGKTYYPHN